MLRSLWLLLVFLIFTVLGISVPFVATLGYVWVDTFQPQAVAYVLLNQIPAAMVLGGLAVVSYMMVDRRAPPPIGFQLIVQLMMAAWVTMTLMWAVAPELAWTKWDWAFKTIIFTAFIPFVIRSRIQIEALIQVYVLSLAGNFIPFGLKVLMSGGGYGMDLGLEAGNSGLGEGGLLSTTCLMAVPLLTYLASHNKIIPHFKLLPLIYWAMAGLAIATAVGTYERSALVGLVVLGFYMWMRSKHKFAFGLIVLLVGAAIVFTASSGWDARISTIGTYEHDNSAYGRLLVWQWTLNFVSSHPFGGGFVAFVIDSIDVPASNGSPAHIEFARAFHSTYFEMLGEHGYPGLAMFLTLAASTFLQLRRAARRANLHPDLEWVSGLARSLESGLAVFLSAGAFVGIGFQPMFWYFVALSVCLRAYMWRVERDDSVEPRRYIPNRAPSGARRPAAAE